MFVKRIWSTPNAFHLLSYIARVSSPKNQVENLNPEGLIRYLLGWRNGAMTSEPAHWSPFEMIHACLEINTTRDIGRQLLRHRSFSFQEFSQRYAAAPALGDFIRREARLQDKANRQSSLEVDDEDLHDWWREAQIMVTASAVQQYKAALDKGIAKEVARVLLPEGATPTRLYMSGSFRSWIHYLDVRLHASTQKEHREIAELIQDVLVAAEPELMGVVEETRELRK